MREEIRTAKLRLSPSLHALAQVAACATQRFRSIVHVRGTLAGLATLLVAAVLCACGSSARCRGSAVPLLAHRVLPDGDYRIVVATGSSPVRSTDGMPIKVAIADGLVSVPAWGLSDLAQSHGDVLWIRDAGPCYEFVLTTSHARCAGRIVPMEDGPWLHED